MTSPRSLPFLSAEIPGIGGRIKSEPEDFAVDELAAYGPSGEGDHVIIRIRKRGITTFEATKRIARALDISPRDIGTAGMKDARAVTTQQLSLPPPTSPELALATQLTYDADGIEILSADRHPHKLRTGHLKGNHFTIVVRDCEVDSETASERAQLVLGQFSKPPGAPNWFGKQRFGNRGDNAEQGRALLGGTYQGRKPKPRVLRLLLSSIQSLLFNEYLISRVQRGAYDKLIDGDVLKKTDSGGVFTTDDLDADALRFDAGAVVATGPMFGPKMIRPPEGTTAAALEASTLEAQGLTVSAFARYAKLAPGTRRPLSVALSAAVVKPIGERAIEVSFSLPSGSYATTVLREVTKPNELD